MSGICGFAATQVTLKLVVLAEISFRVTCLAANARLSGAQTL